MYLRKSRLDILKEEIEDCYTVLESAKVERDVALLISDFNSLEDINATIISMNKRIPALKKLLYNEEHPEEKEPPKEDFIGFILITPEGTGNGQKIT